MGRDPDRRAQLLAAAEEVIERSGPAASMGAIAEAAGVTKPVVYRHFGDKGGLYEALARRYAQRLMERMEPALAADDPQDKVHGTIRAYLEAIAERPATYRFLLDRAAAARPEVSATVGDFTHQLAQLLSSTIAAEFARGGLVVASPVLVAQAIIGMVRQVGDWWLSADDAPGVGAVVENLATLVWKGIPALGASTRHTAAPRPLNDQLQAGGSN